MQVAARLRSHRSNKKLKLKKPKKNDIPRYIPIRESEMANTVRAKNILSIIASEEEIKENVRSRSARLRVIEKI